MQESEVRAYERYLLEDQNLQSGLSQLSQGSKYSDVLQWSHFINHGGEKPKLDFETFRKRHGSLVEPIVAKQLLLKYEEAKDEAAKKAALKEIEEKVLKASFDFKKQVHLKKIKKDEGSSEEEDEETRGIADTLDNKEIFDK